jgi:hypothetical protein
VDTLPGKNAHGSSSNHEKDWDLSAAREAAWKGPEMNLGMADLLRARGGADHALECVTAAGQHLSFVCHVADFVREARTAMAAQCDELLQDALQQELALIEDRFSLFQSSFWDFACSQWRFVINMEDRLLDFRSVCVSC